MANLISKVSKAAKAMIRKNPRLSYREATDKLWNDYRKGKKIGAVKKKAIGKKKKARYVPVKAEHYRRIGSVADPTLAQSMAETKRKLTAKLGWTMVARDNAKTAKARNRYSDQIATLRSRIRALS